MILDDIFGEPVTLGAQSALEPFGRMALGVLSHAAATPDHLAAALAADPDFALAHACRGLFLLSLARRELYAPARAARAAAAAAMAARGATARERAFLAALDDWLDGRPASAAARLEAHLLRRPADGLAFKLGQAIRFMGGDAEGMRRSAERALPRLGPDHPACGYVHGCLAFALEETGAYAAAETAGRRGLELAPDDAWGLHAVAHVYDMTARPAAGVALLDGSRTAWAHCNNFRQHVWWHLALMHLETGEPERALALYDAEIRRERTDDYRDIANAASLLARLELEGVPAGARWDELATLCAARTDDACLAFADLHYLIALLGGGRDGAAEALVRRIARDADGPGAATARRPTLPAARGLRAFAQGRYAAAYASLAGARDAMPRIGGSHAQRDVFERLAVEAALRAGLPDEATALLADRARRRGAWDRFGATRAERAAALRAARPSASPAFA